MTPRRPDRVDRRRVPRYDGGMSENEVKVGDVVAWAEVPDGALVRTGDGAFVFRKHDRGLFALGLTGQESAEDLSGTADAAMKFWADRLYRAGWRPGDGAERAAALLAEVCS